MTFISPALAELQEYHRIKAAQSKGGKKRWMGVSKAERSRLAKAARACGKQKAKE